jgi:hypothetical protein
MRARAQVVEALIERESIGQDALGLGEEERSFRTLPRFSLVTAFSTACDR